MIHTGLVRKIDDLGRVVIPKEMRQNSNFGEGTYVEFFWDDSKWNIIIKPLFSEPDMENIDKMYQTHIPYDNVK